MKITFEVEAPSKSRPAVESPFVRAARNAACYMTFEPGLRYKMISDPSLKDRATLIEFLESMAARNGYKIEVEELKITLTELY